MSRRLGARLSRVLISWVPLALAGPSCGGRTVTAEVGSERCPLPEPPSSWFPGCNDEYESYVACATGAGMRQTECEDSASALEACLLGDGVPSAAGIRAMKACLSYCDVSKSCAPSDGPSDCVRYMCAGRGSSPPGSVQLASAGCADILTDGFQCLIDSPDVCMLPGPCENVLESTRSGCDRLDTIWSPLFDACAVHCHSQHLADPTAPTTADCMESLCLERDVGHRLEERPLCCQVALVRSTECFGEPGEPDCRAELAAVRSACGE